MIIQFNKLFQQHHYRPTIS